MSQTFCDCGSPSNLSIPYDKTETRPIRSPAWKLFFFYGHGRSPFSARLCPVKQFSEWFCWKMEASADCGITSSTPSIV